MLGGQLFLGKLRERQEMFDDYPPDEYYEIDQHDFEYAASQAVVYHSNFSYLLLRGTPVETARKTAVESVKSFYGIRYYSPPLQIEPYDRPF